jgi:hypothetical protein
MEYSKHTATFECSLICSLVVIGTYMKGLIQYKEKKPWYAVVSIFGSLYLTITYLNNIIPLLARRRKMVKWRARSYEFRMSEKYFNNYLANLKRIRLFGKIID